MKLIARILEIGVLLFLIFWLMTVLVDFSNTKQDKEPVFCIRKAIYDYEDGSVSECLGMGYKVYVYNRDAINGRDFVPSWRQPKTSVE